MTDILQKYENGNYTVTIYNDGTKIREFDSKPVPSFPENMDIKLTQWCDNPICRKFCHEQSNESGLPGDLVRGLELLKTWNPGCECAFGGGSTLSHPGLIPFLGKVKKLGLISNLTVNAFHFNKQSELIKQLLKEELFYGLGCSFIDNDSFNQSVKDISLLTDNLVFHLILGIHTLKDVEYIMDNFDNPKILLLGYKQFGNGMNYYQINEPKIKSNIQIWFEQLHTLLDLDEGLILSFDNLAIKQLDLIRFFDEEMWNQFYQGDDGFASMYVDLVKLEYAISSRSETRFKLNKEDTITTIFEKVRST